jgi:hypothetical protein
MKENNFYPRILNPEKYGSERQAKTTNTERIHPH